MTNDIVHGNLQSEFKNNKFLRENELGSVNNVSLCMHTKQSKYNVLNVLAKYIKHFWEKSQKCSLKTQLINSKSFVPKWKQKY